MRAHPTFVLIVVLIYVERRLMPRRIAQAALVGGVTTAMARASGASAPQAVPARVWADPVGLHWTAAQPAIIRRADWDTVSPRTQPPAPRYADAAEAVFVHHTDSGNAYGLSEVPGIIWSINDDHTTRRGCDDIGHSFLVDRFGNIYQSRRGGNDRPVIGAHTSGFNVATASIAAIGTFTEGATVPPATLHAISALAAWKLSLYDVDTLSSTVLTCSDSLSRFPRAAGPSSRSSPGTPTPTAPTAPAQRSALLCPQSADRRP
jgi:hypothetical protein